MRYIIVFVLCLAFGIMYGMNLRMNDMQSKLDSYVDCINSMDSEITGLNSKIIKLSNEVYVNIRLNKLIIRTNTKLHNELVIADAKLKGLN